MRIKAPRLQKPWAPALKGLGLICAAVVIGLYFTGRFYAFHLKLPEMCDEFGYLNQAKAIAENKVFGNHALGPFDSGLISALKNSGFDYRSYSHLIAPHAYHLDEKSGRVINQYPPGTGLVLSVFPLPFRKIAFPGVCVILFFAFLVFAFRMPAGEVTLFEIGLAVIITALASNMVVFRDGLKTVNSIAPTLGMLFASGYLLTRKPRLSMFLLGLSCLFRIANLLLAVPLLFFYVISRVPRGGLFSRRTIRDGTALVLAFLAGCGLYLAYAGILLGNPFRSTYSYFDRIWNPAAALEHLRFYWSWDQPWFRLHVFVLLALALGVFLAKKDRKLLVFSVLATFFNYAFYVFHDVKISYYPYASSVLIAGVLLSFLLDRIKKISFLRSSVAVIGLLILGYAVLASTKTFAGFRRRDVRGTFERQVETYRRCFSRYDVVWAELRTGTVEYATSKAGFRYNWGPDEVRTMVMGWLASHGYRQAVFVGDLDIPIEKIEQDAQAAGLGVRVLSCEDFGPLLEIFAR